MLLNRSAPLPISVSLAHSDGVDYTAIFAAMMPTVSRWKNLSLDSYSFGDLSYLDLTPGSFTALETLNLVICSGWPRQIEPFSLCPRLRHLTLKNVGDRLGHDVLQLPWAQLTHLDLRHYALPTCCFILLQCTNLVSAKLTIRGSGTADLHVPARVLPFLKTLEVEFIRMGDFVERVGPLFIALSVPSLQNFALAANVVWPAEEFSSFQMRAPNIAQISLESCLITCQELVTLLRLTPALIALKLKWCKNCMDDEFVQVFAYDETRAQRLVPRLQKLDWQPMNEMNKYLGAFEAAIRSRGWTSNTAPPNVAQLRMVKVTSLRRIPRHWMQDLVEQGLELHLS
jgi:hypothetical protein